MCDLVSAGIAAASAAASLYGTSVSSSAAARSANAVAAQNRADLLAQNEGFTSRLNTSLAQTSRQRDVASQSYTDRAAAAQVMRDAQNKALQSYKDILDTENTKAASLRATGDTAAGKLLDATTGTNLADAQTARTNEITDLQTANAVPAGPTATDPNNAAGSDPATQAATSRRTAQAATNIRDYGSKIAKVSGYDAPTQSVDLALQANKYGIMPAQTADYLLRSGSATRLLPATTAYNAATEEGKAYDTLLTTKGEAALNSAKLSYDNATSLANLKQADETTTAKNIADQTEANAAYDKTQGNIISGIGNLGLYGVGYYKGGDINKKVSSIL